MSSMSALNKRSPWRHLARRLGVPGLMGVSLGLAVAWGWLIWLPPQQAEHLEAQDQVAHLRQQLMAAAGTAARKTPGLSRAGAEALWPLLWASLPDADESAALQGHLLDEAASQQVTLQAVQYRGAAQKGLPGLWRQQISLPLEAQYPAVRAWLDWILRQPAMSLDAVDIVRADPVSEVVKARVQVSLWWRTGAVPAVAEGPRREADPLAARSP